jgi:hypothetical protein
MQYYIQLLFKVIYKISSKYIILISTTMELGQIVVINQSEYVLEIINNGFAISMEDISVASPLTIV